MSKDKEENPPAAMERAKVAPMTADEKKEAQKRWDEMISRFRNAESKVLLDILVLHWEKGKECHTLTSEPRTYGNKTVEHFATELGYHPSLVYAYQAFHRNYTMEEVRKAAARRIAWHNLLYLVTVKDKEKREALEIKFSDSQKDPEKAWDSKKLQEEVKKLNKTERKKLEAAGKKVDKRGGSTPSRIMRSTANICFETIKKVEEYTAVYEEISKLEDPARKEDMLERHKEARKALVSLQTSVDKALKTIDAV